MFSLLTRAAHPVRALTATTTTTRLTSHSADTYSKDVDATPPPDSKIHRVDPTNLSSAQKPSEQPANEFSKVGAESAMQSNYKTMSKDEPYKAPGPKERYGSVGTEGLHDRASEREGTGPAGKDKEGRK